MSREWYFKHRMGWATRRGAVNVHFWLWDQIEEGRYMLSLGWGTRNDVFRKKSMRDYRYWPIEGKDLNLKHFRERWGC